ncbi:uncharacterized protein K441DRAFT_685289 [Cenococcum geophilum 1.58]|uniref:uncharacterized protein n=1 Tax=Cenococcum geophilum 1.58 TaxID=794803 RepID=UPI00358FEE33|nr:hypothetical protein K441DRAFT_685289 [Cenococcum geophilum 1.58]
MDFTDFVSDSGLTSLSFGSYDLFFKARSYILYSSQADVKCFQAIKSPPEVAMYPCAYRWYNHVASFEPGFSSLPGDPSKSHTAYGPESSELTVNPAKAPAAEAEEEEDYKKKKEGKTKPAAKSIVSLDVKPWDDETDMKELEANVRAIEKEGLVWGASKLAAVGFGIKKLQINLVVEDEKVSLYELQGQVEEDEDHVQSTDSAAMQKL